MLFSIIRLALGGLVFLIICGLIRKKKIMNSRRWTVIAFVSAILLTTIAALIPIENLFITFSSPDSAYHYNHLGKVRLIVPGQQTDFVVGNDGESDIYVIVPKKSDRWQIGMGTDQRGLTSMSISIKRAMIIMLLYSMQTVEHPILWIIVTLRFNTLKLQLKL